MALFLITGLPGTGKSTVCTELKSRGFEAYDADKDHLAKWYSKSTGVPVEGKFTHNRIFLQTHSRDIARETVSELALQARDKAIFVCGDPENEEELSELFSRIFALVTDEETRFHRLVTRTDNNWGKLPEEREHDLPFVQKSRDMYKQVNYEILDATKPTTEIVDKILEKVGKDPIH